MEVRLRFLPVPYTALEVTDLSEHGAVNDIYRRAHSLRWQSFKVTERSLASKWGVSSRRVWAILERLEDADLLTVTRGSKRKQTVIEVFCPTEEVKHKGQQSGQQNGAGWSGAIDESEAQNVAQSVAPSTRDETRTEMYRLPSVDSADADAEASDTGATVSEMETTDEVSDDERADLDQGRRGARDHGRPARRQGPGHGVTVGPGVVDGAALDERATGDGGGVPRVVAGGDGGGVSTASQREVIGLPTAARRALDRSGLTSPALCAVLTRSQLLELDGIGAKTADSVEVWLAGHGLALRPERPKPVKPSTRMWTDLWSEVWLDRQGAKYQWPKGGEFHRAAADTMGLATACGMDEVVFRRCCGVWHDWIAADEWLARPPTPGRARQSATALLNAAPARRRGEYAPKTAEWTAENERRKAIHLAMRGAK